MKNSRRRGQVTTEYILLAVFLITILMAISGILNSFIDDAGQTIETKASEVMSQRTMGIPLSWFFADTGGKIPPPGGSGPGGGPGGGPGSGPANTPAGGNPGSGPGGSGPGGGGDPGGTNGDNPNGGADAGGPDSSGDDAAGDSDGRGRRRGRSGDFVSVDGGNNDKESTPTKADERKDDDKKDSSAGPDGPGRREFAVTNEEDRRKGSCEDFDLFTLLKILAIVVLIVFGGAYLMSASGNRGGNKK